jgi:hypothetical protein
LKRDLFGREGFGCMQSNLALNVTFQSRMIDMSEDFGAIQRGSGTCGPGTCIVEISECLSGVPGDS